MNELEQQLETFRINFPYTRLYVFEDSISYKMLPKHSDKMVEEAKSLIKEKELDLLDAEASCIIFNDVLRIKAK